MNMKFKLFMAVLIALATTMPSMAHNVFTLYNGGQSSTTAPINNAYLDEVGTRTQVIYPAADLTPMYNEVINSIKFYTYNPISVSGGAIEVSVGETSQNEFNGAGTYVEGLTPVATISMVNGATEIEIVFDTPYLYHGGNFVVETLLTEATDYCFITYKGARPQNYSAMTRNEVEKFLPMTTFDYGITADYNAKVMPDELTFNTIRAERTDTMSLTLINTGLMAFSPTLRSVDAPFIVNIPDTVIPAGRSLDIPVVFAPTEEGTYNATLSIDCGAAGIVEAALHGTALVAVVDVTVGDETDYAGYVPIYATDIDIVGTSSQIIYHADSLRSMVGQDILALKFHLKNKVTMEGGVIQLSFKEVTNDYFTAATPETGLTAVATVSPVYNSEEFAFMLDEPYKYNGGNLLIECRVIEAGTTHYSQTFFYGTPVESNVAIYTSKDYGSMVTEFVPFLPEVTFSYQKKDADLLLGDVNLDGLVNVSDATLLINYLLNGNFEVPENADYNQDGFINISDATALISFLLM